MQPTKLSRNPIPIIDVMRLLHRLFADNEFAVCHIRAYNVIQVQQ